MSVTRGGTAPNPCRRGGSWSSTPAHGIVAVFSMWNWPPRATRSIWNLRDSWCRPRRPGTRTRGTGSCAGVLERHLVVGAKIDRLDMAPSPQIPEMDPMAILVREQSWDDPILELAAAAPIRWSPCSRAVGSTRNHSAGLGAPIDLPAAEDVKRLAVHDKHARWPIGAIAPPPSVLT